MRNSNPPTNSRKLRWLGVLVAGLLICIVALFALRRERQPNRTVEKTAAPGATSEGALGEFPAQEGGRPSANGLISASSKPARRLTQKILKYGGGEGEVGMARSNGETPIGPESFTLGPNGTILVADRVNHRVSVWSADGTYLRSIRIDGLNLNDLVADDRGQLYVYDQVRRVLRQYDASGSPVAELQINSADLETRGYFHAAGDAIYFADAAARDVLVGTLKDGVLTAPDQTSERRAEGIHAASGRIYSVDIVRNQALRVGLGGRPAQTASPRIDLAFPGILSARYAGEDVQRRFYVQAERLIDGKVKLEVLTFGSDGRLQQSTRLPENGYAIWTSKLVEVGSGGAIVQFLPGEDDARLNLFLE